MKWDLDFSIILIKLALSLAQLQFQLVFTVLTQTDKPSPRCFVAEA